MSELTSLSATGLAGLIRAREVSPVEAVEAYLARIESLNGALNAIVTLAPDALERAREMEAAVMRGDETGALHGVPVTVKDTFDVAGLRSTSGSRLRAGRIAQRDAEAVRRLRSAGAIILGKTNVPEMALTYDSDNLVFGRTMNPHDYSRTPGGSSGGEAASVAASLSAAGLGSDLVGSIRIPAHFCGVFGLKPTASAVSGVGHCPRMVGRLREAAAFGPLARSAQDLSLMFEALAGEAFIVDKESEEAPPARVAFYTHDGLTKVTAETERAVESAARALSEAGFEVAEARPPGVERAPALWTERFSPDVLEAMREVYRTAEDEEKAGRAVRALLERGSGAPVKTEAERLMIDEECARLRHALIEWMAEHPFLLAPVGAVPAFEHGARKVYVDGREMSVFSAFSYAQSFNTLDMPVVSVPVARTTEELPLGVQLIGRPHSERSLLKIARILEEASGGFKQG
ncbi:MAG TPA: amidase [Pyrinomonadaceae bacterium]|nr:amidase [Pyrinomonadaceae bacterium]